MGGEFHTWADDAQKFDHLREKSRQQTSFSLAGEADPPQMFGSRLGRSGYEGQISGPKENKKTRTGRVFSVVGRGGLEPTTR